MIASIGVIITLASPSDALTELHGYAYPIVTKSEPMTTWDMQSLTSSENITVTICPENLTTSSISSSTLCSNSITSSFPQELTSTPCPSESFSTITIVSAHYDEETSATLPSETCSRMSIESPHTITKTCTNQLVHEPLETIPTNYSKTVIRCQHCAHIGIIAQSTTVCNTSIAQSRTSTVSLGPWPTTPGGSTYNSGSAAALGTRRSLWDFVVKIIVTWLMVA